MKKYKLNKHKSFYENLFFIAFSLMIIYILYKDFNVLHFILFIIWTLFLLEIYYKQGYAEFILTNQQLIFKKKTFLTGGKTIEKKISWDKIEKIITLEDYEKHGTHLVVNKRSLFFISHTLIENYQDLLKEICDRATDATVDDLTRIVIKEGIQLWGQKKYFFPKTVQGKIIGSISLLLLLYAIVILFDHYSVLFFNYLSTQAYLSIEFILMVIVGVLFIPLWRK